MKVGYYLGRSLQVVALILMPSAIWVAQFGHNERGTITIFVSAISIFFVGWVLIRVR